MWTPLVVTVAALVFMAIGILGKRFVIGLSVRRPMPTSAGRVWFIIIGAFLFLTGLTELAPRLGMSQEVRRRLNLFSGYADLLSSLFLCSTAIVMVVVACLVIFSVIRKGGDRKRLLLGIVLLIAGMLFVWSSVLSITTR
jgi:hypothetical protein